MTQTGEGAYRSNEGASPPGVQKNPRPFASQSAVPWYIKRFGTQGGRGGRRRRWTASRLWVAIVNGSLLRSAAAGTALWPWGPQNGPSSGPEIPRPLLLGG